MQNNQVKEASHKTHRAGLFLRTVPEPARERWGYTHGQWSPLGPQGPGTETDKPSDGEYTALIHVLDTKSWL